MVSWLGWSKKCVLFVYKMKRTLTRSQIAYAEKLWYYSIGKATNNWQLQYQRIFHFPPSIDKLYYYYLGFVIETLQVRFKLFHSTRSALWRWWSKFEYECYTRRNVDIIYSWTIRPVKFFTYFIWFYESVKITKKVVIRRDGTSICRGGGALIFVRGRMGIETCIHVLLRNWRGIIVV